MTDLEYVMQNVDRRTLLEQLAEESTELAQASLKLIRALKLSNNSTPVSALKAYSNLMEEIDDINLVLTVLELKRVDNDVINNPKLKRWVNRLKGL